VRTKGGREGGIQAYIRYRPRTVAIDGLLSFNFAVVEDEIRELWRRKLRNISCTLYIFVPGFYVPVNYYCSANKELSTHYTCIILCIVTLSSLISMYSISVSAK
jgi:hypothetical protein